MEAVPFPLLNRGSVAIIIRSAFKSELSERGWLIRYLGMASRNRNLAKKSSKSNCTTYANYAQLLTRFRNKESKSLIEASFKLPFLKKACSFISMKQYMKYPSQELPFKDIIANEAWQNDDVFTMQRLAGLNPMSLRKMTNKDFNEDFVNKNYDWDAAMQRASGEQTVRFTEMIDRGRVFIIEYKMLHNLTEQDGTGKRKIEKSRSPFCTFVTVKGSNGSNRSKGLKPVAIQIDLIPDAPVFSPVDGLEWLKAKEEIQRADLFYVELVEHLLKTHLLMEPICVIMRRTLSRYHPLHQILKWHCRGLFVVNSVGMKALLGVGEFLDKLFAFGYAGSLELLKRAYRNLSWADTEFNENLKKRGVHKVEELPYFPYRDDGLLIWKTIGDFARDYVKLYYLNDQDVIQDSELKNFANQLSADGTGSNGGIGMLKGFPAKIQTRSQLNDVLKRIVFINVQHHSVNYPVVYFAGFVPNMPSKLYVDRQGPPHEFRFDSLPQAEDAAEQISLAMSLGSIRYDVILDYGKQLKDDRARILVNKYHNRLIVTVNDEITTRNQYRLGNGTLAYPYLLPKWMPNSIHT